MINQEETDEDVADEENQEVDSRDQRMHIRQLSVILKSTGPDRV